MALSFLEIASERWLSALGAAARAWALYMAYVVVSWAWNSRRPRDYPPGPKTLPWLGNILDMPATKQYIKYSELGDEYGELVGLKFATQNVVILNSARVVHELLEKRHEIYSGRVYHGILKHVMADGPHITISEGEYLRRWRTAARMLLKPSALREVLPQNSAAAAFCVQQIIQAAADNNNDGDDGQSESIFRAIETWAMTGPLKAVCSVSGADRDPAWTRWYMDFSKINLEVMEPASIPPLDLFPVLHYMPTFLAPWKVQAHRVNDDREEICNFTFRNAQAGYARYKAAAERGKKLQHESLMARVIRGQEEGGADRKTTFTDDEISKIGGGLLEASIHTTLASFRSWLKILCAHPHVVVKIQEELDAVCGATSPPNDTHLKSLPYLEACLQEAWRWRIPTPVSLPHRLIKDDVFEGYRIPKDTVIIQNTYRILRDRDYFDAPDDYVPERYLDNPTGLKAGAATSAGSGAYSRATSFVFGAGRRACPGDLFSWQSMMMLMAKLLWASDLRAAAGDKIDVSLEGYFGETLIDPLPWKMTIVPKSCERRKAAEADCQALLPLLD
ncbi:cytochrome P450 [Xylaria palmicola]|nr:cytochrome P450 [Xylaria palmicola]